MAPFNNDAPSDPADDEIVRREARLRNMSETLYRMTRACPTSLMQDIANDLRSGPARPSSIIPDNNRSAPAAPGSGWQKERPLRAPEGVNLIDRMCDTADALERIQTAHERAKVTLDLRAYEIQREQELEARRRARELDPCNTGIYKTKDQLDRGE
jgi:hypothetical protein